MNLCNWRLSICGLNMRRHGSTFFRNTSTIFRRKASMFDGVKFWPIPLWYDQPIACGAVLLLFSACVRPFSEAKIKSQVRPCKSWGIWAGHSSTALGDYPPVLPVICSNGMSPNSTTRSWAPWVDGVGAYPSHDSSNFSLLQDAYLSSSCIRFKYAWSCIPSGDQT